MVHLQLSHDLLHQGAAQQGFLAPFKIFRPSRSRSHFNHIQSTSKQSHRLIFHPITIKMNDEQFSATDIANGTREGLDGHWKSNPKRFQKHQSSDFTQVKELGELVVCWVGSLSKTLSLLCLSIVQSTVHMHPCAPICLFGIACLTLSYLVLLLLVAVFPGFRTDLFAVVVRLFSHQVYAAAHIVVTLNWNHRFKPDMANTLSILGLRGVDAMYTPRSKQSLSAFVDTLNGIATNDLFDGGLDVEDCIGKYHTFESVLTCAAPSVFHV